MSIYILKQKALVLLIDLGTNTKKFILANVNNFFKIDICNYLKLYVSYTCVFHTILLAW